MDFGNWVPISKFLVSSLPLDREFSEVEAAFSLQCSYDKNEDVTLAGFASRWRWSRGKVIRFLEKMSASISYDQNTKNLRNQRGHIMIHKTDIKRTYNGHIRLIDSNDIETKTDIKRTKDGHKTDIKRYAIEDTNPKTKKYKVQKDPYGSFQNVFLSEDEFKKLKEKFNGTAEDRIEKLSVYVASKGTKYKSHYATIISWSLKDVPKPQDNEKW